MKKLKFVVWLLLIGLFALLIYQNLDFFSTTYSMKIDLGFYSQQTPAITNGVIIAFFVGASVLIMLIYYLSSRYENFRARKMIKRLTRTLDESSALINSLKSELEPQSKDAATSSGDESSSSEKESSDAKTSDAAGAA